MLGKKATRNLSLFVSEYPFVNVTIAVTDMIIMITPNTTTEIFIKQRYKSGLNSDRILAPAITK